MTNSRKKAQKVKNEIWIRRKDRKKSRLLTPRLKLLLLLPITTHESLIASHFPVFPLRHTIRLLLKSPGFTITAILGRPFSTQEDVPHGPLLAVISERFWKNHFNGDPGVIGKKLTLSEQSFQIIGVAPAQVGRQSVTPHAETLPGAACRTHAL